MPSVIPKEDKPGDATSTEWRGWSACVAALGTPAFAERLLDAVDRAIGVDHLSLFRVGPDMRPALAAAVSRERGDVARDAGRRYMAALYYRFDPNTDRLHAEGREASGPLVTRMRASEIPDPAYRREIYERYALIDRLSVIDHTGPVWRVLNFYRDQPAGEFDAADIAAFQARAPLISALVGRHLALQPPGATTAAPPPVAMLERLVSDLGAGLTPREVEVCALALLGKTGTGIALDLGVKEPTVATLRKRAYAKLGISTLNELFALCLSRSASLARGDAG